jgi:hypothetical protein
MAAAARQVALGALGPRVSGAYNRYQEAREGTSWETAYGLYLSALALQKTFGRLAAEDDPDRTRMSPPELCRRIEPYKISRIRSATETALQREYGSHLPSAIFAPRQSPVPPRSAPAPPRRTIAQRVRNAFGRTRRTPRTGLAEQTNATPSALEAVVPEPAPTPAATSNITMNRRGRPHSSLTGWFVPRSTASPAAAAPAAATHNITINRRGRPHSRLTGWFLPRSAISPAAAAPASAHGGTRRRK